MSELFKGRKLFKGGNYMRKYGTYPRGPESVSIEISPFGSHNDNIFKNCFLLSKVLYMWSSFWLLGVESRDFSHAKKERATYKAVQIHKMTTIFVQNDPRLSFWVKKKCHFVDMPNFASSSFFLSVRKITWLNSQQPKTRAHVEDLNLVSQCSH